METKLTDEQFTDLLNVVKERILSVKYNDPTRVYFKSLIEIYPKLRWEEIPTHQILNVIRNGKESSTIRILTDIEDVSNLEIVLIKPNRDQMALSVRDKDNRNAIYSVYIFDSHILTRNNNVVDVNISDKDYVDSHYDISEGNLLNFPNNSCAKVISDCVMLKREKIFNELKNDIDILYKNCINTTRLCRFSETVSCIGSMSWSL